MRRKLFIVVMLFVLALVVRGQLRGMDGRWFQPSLAGAQGLARYLLGDYSGAARAYRLHFQQLCEGYRAASDSAWHALVCGDLRMARQKAQEELKRDLSSTHTLLTLGEVALAEKNFDPALELFHRVLTLERDQFDALLLSSVAYAQVGRYGEAIDALNRGLRHSVVETRLTAFLAALEVAGDLARLPADGRPWCLLAHYYRYLRIFDDANGKVAIQYAQRAIEKGDRADDAYLTLGVIHAKQGRWEASLSAFLKAVEINPRNAEAHRWAGRQYLRGGDLLNGYRMTRAAFEAAPTDLHYAEALYDLLSNQLGDYPQALAIARVMSERHPDRVEGLRLVAHTLFQMGDYQESVKHYRQALALDPRNPLLLEDLGAGLRGLERTEEAMEAFHQARTISPTRPRPYALIGMTHYRERRYKEAVAEFQRAVSLGARDWHTLGWLCHAYQANLQFDQSTSCWRSFAARFPDEVVPLPSLPEVLNNMWVAERQR